MAEGAGARVLVTGANGFVGTAVCRQLLADGFCVRGAVRSAAAESTLPPAVDRTIVEDPYTTGSWSEALDGVTAVVHLIARAHHLEDVHGSEVEAKYRRVNVDITRALVAAARDADVTHYVYMSSIKAMGEGKDGWYTEDETPAPTTIYGRTKLEAEGVVSAFGDADGRTATVLRPPMVYGPGARGNFERLMSLVARGWPLPLGRANARRSLIALDNLADAVSHVLGHQRAQGTYHVADSEALEVRELVRRLGQAMGRPVRLLPVPVGFLEGLGRLAGKSDEVARLTRPLLVSAGRIETALGWSPPVDVDTALKRAVAPNGGPQ